jgi:hypothetical protein
VDVDKILWRGVKWKGIVNNEEQRCQMIFFKSARSDVKIRQNPPETINQIRQKSARN